MSAAEIIRYGFFQTVDILSGTLPVMFITLLLVDLALKMGWLGRVSRFMGPVVKKTRLPSEVLTSFAASFGSQVSGAVVLERLRRENRISKSELLLVSQINTLPLHVRELFTYFIPVTIPVLGLAPGIIYTGSMFFVLVFKSAVVLVFGRLLLKRKRTPDHEDGAAVPERQTLVFGRDLLRSSIRDSAAHLLGMSRLLIITTFMVAVAEGCGFFLWLQTMAGPFMSVLRIPDGMLAPALTYLGNSMAANYMVGAMYKSGAVGYETAAVTVLAGSIIALPVVFLKHSFARNISVFGTGLGILNSVFTLGLGMLARGLYLLAFLLIVIR
jgi:hypothetical protein